MTVSAAPAPTVPRTPPPEHRAPRRRRLLVTVLVVLALVLAAGGWLAWRAGQVADALEGAVPVIGRLQEDLESGDVEAATARLPRLREAARTAHAATADPLWRAAEHLPWVGRQMSAVSDVTDAFDLLALDAVPALTRAGAGLDVDSLRPVDGRVDLAPVVAAAPHLAEASSAATAAQEIVDAIGVDLLAGPLAARVVEVQETVGEAASSVRAASTVAELVPAMLGVDGRREYLVLVLNSAELRNGGGLVGAVAKITAEDGALTLADHRAARDLPSFDAPVLPLTAEEELVHSSRLGRYMQNVTMTPDFPRAAELATEIWQRATDETVDGVLAMDATALSYVLGATGAVEQDGVRLDAEGVVRSLLHESYLTHPDPDETDEYFAGAAAAVFGALATGQGDQRALVPAVSKAVEERRLALWSAHPAEQEHLTTTVLGGGFLSGAADSAAGVFLDDATGSKIDYFLEVGLEAEPLACAQADGTGTVVVRLDLRSTVPADVASLPAYVVGAGVAVPAGTARTNLTVYSPVGGEVVEVRQGSAVVGGRVGEQSGRDVVVLTSTLAPGEQESFELVVRPYEGRTISELWTTATVAGGGRAPIADCA